ncbi:MAG TPA: hypothetical protein H9881_12135 [Candidatus Stackebrandtia excrementipullorum]|nr:hypothetical protein [Candidatus Stackebrandtia excrementipullorum]
MVKVRRRRILIWAVVVIVGIAGLTAGHAMGLFGFGPVAGAEEGVTGPDGDTYTMSAQPEVNTGAHTELLVGSTVDQGVLVTYMRFTVPSKWQAAPATLRMTLTEPAATQGLLEVTLVDPMWSESGLVAAEVPPSGTVLDTVAVSPDDEAVEFDASAAIVPGEVVAFAVSTPATDRLWRMNSRESDGDGPILQLNPSDPDAHVAHGPEAAPVGAERCEVGELLVPTCGSLLGVAPGAHMPGSKTEALLRFEELTGKRQHVYHSYHRGVGKLFPTPDETDVASDPENGRILFINWKPSQASWADIAAGDPETDDYLDELADHIGSTFGRPMFFTVHHEPENDVRPEDGSGYTADDYAAMYRYVVERLRSGGADNLVSVMVYMAYLKWTAMPWHEDLYPGDDVVDWVGWDAYGYSDPGYGHGDFAELVNRVSGLDPDWPGFYNWAATSLPTNR